MASDLTAHAQAWADKLVKENKFAHSKCTLDGGEKIGENIAMKWTSDAEARYTGERLPYQVFHMIFFMSDEFNVKYLKMHGMIWGGA